MRSIYEKTVHFMNEITFPEVLDLQERQVEVLIRIMEVSPQRVEVTKKDSVPNKKNFLVIVDVEYKKRAQPKPSQSFAAKCNCKTRTSSVQIVEPKLQPRRAVEFS